MVEHPLDAVSILVMSEIAGGRVLPVGHRWNDRPIAVDQEFFAQEIAVIAFVGKKQSRLRTRTTFCKPCLRNEARKPDQERSPSACPWRQARGARISVDYVA